MCVSRSQRFSVLVRAASAAFVAGLVAIGPAVAQEPLSPTTVLASVDHRQAMDLDGPWHYVPDPYRNGWGGWPSAPEFPSKNGFIADKHYVPGGPLQEYDFAKYPTLAVPGGWNSQRPELLWYEGLIWYERTVDYHLKPGQRAFLHFGAVSYRANVAVNGQNVCMHEGAFTSFDCEVTKQLKDGENSIVIGVDNERKRERVPTTKTDWWNYGGLTGAVSLVGVPEKFVDQESLQLEKGAGDTIHGWAHIEGADSGEAVTLRIPELGVEEHAKTGADGRAEFTVQPKKLERWSPDSPKLYRVEWLAGGDTLTDDVGFRTIEVKGDRILLNGKPLFLRGVCMHAEVPRKEANFPGSETGRAWSDADARLLFSWVKELHGNFVRMSHYPYPEPFLREADREGLLVWSEIPVYWSIDWTNPAALKSAQQQLHELIERDRNHAAIAMWSMSNETPPSPERNEFLHKLIDQARGEDPTRLITSAIVTRFHKGPNGEQVATLDDAIGQYLDVLGYNEYIGWYVGKPGEAVNYRWENPLGKPVILSEFGGGAKAGMHGSPDERFTEEYQVKLFEDQFAMQAKMPFLAGITPWVLMDFRSPTRMLPGIQDDYNRKGIVSATGIKKAAYATIRDHYTEIAKHPESQ